ncbi:MAG: hypothetical protein A3B31_03470 [Candidatus Komeilibacteria bacterium RIFCSPLOWO2_01_FULL_53_11]|uniref:SUF system FeS cluster assembly SufBD core domain-containing protein n=1 Tax=Candidatus Komeilibacteria bacterium RIFCSPLOWO2_01_FULL_53_11 TaxID=1798552 RepID=A0A1G2BTB7_9BACT|nr:MAG: hypothetical protein A3B31_03470 [Candidatus Komeilibacteria bacterium RIFCSPLOWO2_01_FULL_53_11]
MKTAPQTIVIDVDKGSRVAKYTVASGKALMYFFIQGLSNDATRAITITLGRESALAVYGLAIGSGDQKLRTDLSIIHVKPGARSHVILKGVFTDTAQGVLNGTILIRPSAQKTDTRLEERVLLLSPDAYAETIPNLEILADDVKASHAAAIGRISEEEIFYLQSRGIERKAAQRMIVHAFLGSIVAHLSDEKVRAKLEALLRKKIAHLNV